LIDRDVLTDDKAVTDLLQKLTYLSLAIVQAVVYINRNQITLSQYVALLDDTEQNIINVLSKEFEDKGRYENVKNPIATTWFISFEQICARDPLAAEYLSFMSCVDAKDIPQSLLPLAQSSVMAVDAIGTLSAYSFIAKHKTTWWSSLATGAGSSGSVRALSVEGNLRRFAGRGSSSSSSPS